MHSKEVSTVRVNKGSFTNGENAIYLHFVALAHIKHTCVMLTNWSNTIRNGDTKKKE